MGLTIKKNDTVYVRSGKSRGRTGRVLMVLPDKSKALVEGVNLQIHHERQRKQGQPAGRVSKEGPMPLSCLMVVDPKTQEPGRIRNEVRNGKKVRIHSKTGNEV